jgi:hypothetical protein
MYGRLKINLEKREVPQNFYLLRIILTIILRVRFRNLLIPVHGWLDDIYMSLAYLFKFKLLWSSSFNILFMCSSVGCGASKKINLTL